MNRDEVSGEDTDGRETSGSAEEHSFEDDRGESQPTPPGTEGSGVTQLDSETAARSDDAAKESETPTTDASEDDASGRDADTATSESSHGAETGPFVLDEIREKRGLTDDVEDEFVTFRNAGDEALNLSGWVVENDDGQQYVFSDGFTLDSGQSVTIHSGRGSDTETDVHWGATSVVWDETGDTILVRTADGREVLREPFGT